MHGATYDGTGERSNGRFHQHQEVAYNNFPYEFTQGAYSNLSRLLGVDSHQESPQIRELSSKAYLKNNSPRK